jgi:hypothetical protein
LGFVRQFEAHADEHRYWISELVDAPEGTLSLKGDTLADNVDAWVWNVLCAAEYFYENQDMFREAFSKWPVGSPFHRLDRREPEKSQDRGEALKNAAQRVDDEQRMKIELQAFMNAKGVVRTAVGDFEIVRIR